MSDKIRDYSKYPVYTQEEIQKAFDEATELWNDFESLRQKIVEMKSANNLEDKDVLEKNPEFYESFYLFKVKAEHAGKGANSMVEANFYVINSKKTIERAMEDSVKLIFTFEDSEAKKRFKAFKARILKNK